MQIHSPAFEHGEEIPKKYTEDGNNVSPPLGWSDVPGAAVELVLIMDDPDAPRADPFVHWLVYHIPADAPGLPEGVRHGEELREPTGALQGHSSFTKNNLGYRGPAPPKGHGVHHYHFRLYALREPMTLAAGVGREALEGAMEGKIITQAELVGTYQRK